MCRSYSIFRDTFFFQRLPLRQLFAGQKKTGKQWAFHGLPVYRIANLLLRQRLTKLLRQCRHKLENVFYDTDVGHLEDGGLGVFVYRYDER